MKKLCFGTLLNLVYQAKGQGVTYKSICDAVFSAYGCADATNRDSSLPPHLKSGHDNVPPDVIDAARAITYEDAVIAFDSGVVGLIAEANAKQFIYAVKAVLREDDVPDDTLIGSVAGFEKSAILERNKFIMAPLMASLFRYAIVDVSNADCADSLKSFEKNYLIIPYNYLFKFRFVSIKVSEFHLQFHEQFYCSYQFLRYQVTDTYESFRHFCQ